MPENKDIEKNEHWLKKAWKTKLAVLAVLTVLRGVFEGVYWVTEKWHEYKMTPKRIVKEVKRYRDWKGRWYEIFRDKESSDLYAIDYFYYIDKQTDEKIYCW